MKAEEVPEGPATMEMQRAFEGRLLVRKRTSFPFSSPILQVQGVKGAGPLEMVQQTRFLVAPWSPACWLLREIPARRWRICAWDEAGPGWGIAEATRPAACPHKRSTGCGSSSGGGAA